MKKKSLISDWLTEFMYNLSESFDQQMEKHS